MRKVQIATGIITTAVECYALAEMVWYFTHDGDETLREAIVGWWETYCERAEDRSRVRATRDMIRDLPEA